MKTITSLFLFALVSVSAFAADTIWPGWNCNDSARIEVALAATTDANRKVDLNILKNIVAEKPASYEALCKIIDTAVNAQTNIPETYKLHLKNAYKKQIPLLRSIFLKEAWAFCKANPSAYDINYYLYDSAMQALSMTDVERYSGLLNCLLTYNCSAGQVKSAVTLLIDLGINEKITTQKEDLTKLNRKYSKMLLTDKATWEPVIALIRTAIDTY